MEWQATTGEQISVVGGYCVAPARGGAATQCDNKGLETPPERTTQLRAVWLAYRHGKPGPSIRAFAAAMLEWRPAALLVTPQARLPLTQYVERYLGPATVLRGRTRGWRLGPAQYRLLATDYARGRNAEPAAQDTADAAGRPAAGAAGAPPAKPESSGPGSPPAPPGSFSCQLAGNCWVAKAAAHS
jgi:hypothetical protein